MMVSGKGEDFYIENFRILANVLFASVTKLGFPAANLTDPQLLTVPANFIILRRFPESATE